MTDLKTVVIVAPFFPPSGAPPVHRARQFAQWLPEYGWKPVVLSVRPEFYQEKLDDELLNLVPPVLEVIRAKAFRPKKPGGWGVGDLGLRSVLHLWLELRRICKERKVDLIYLTCPPNFQLVIGRLIRAEFGIPYILDFTDPWVSDWLSENAKPFTKLWLSHLSALLLEPFAVKRAAHITAVSAGTNQGMMRRYIKLDDSDFTAMPIGGEAEVFEYLKRSPSKSVLNSSNGNFHLVYVGAMWEAAYPVLGCFLDSLQLLKTSRPDLYSKLKVHFIGTTYRPDAAGHYQVLPMAKEKGVEDAITEMPERLPYLDALRTLIEADGLLMLGSVEPHYTASRLFPYVHSGRPILSLYHQASDGTKILLENNAKLTVTYSSIDDLRTKCEEMRAALVSMLSNGRRENRQNLTESLEQFSARSLTGKLAAIFDRVTKSPLRAQ